MKRWLFFVLLSCSFQLSAEKQEILFWHALDGYLSERLVEVIEQFNESSSEFRVVAEYKGNYTETVEAGLKAAKKGKPPHLLQVYEVATETMLLHPKIYLSFEELMQRYAKDFSKNSFVEVVSTFYSSKEGEMVAFPWIASTGVLFYNKEAFQKAGLNPEQPPKTWQELEVACRALQKAGYSGFTTAWPFIYHIEQYASVHNLEIASARNGFDGLDARLTFNRTPFVEHIQKLCDLQKEQFFVYGGRHNSAESLFIQGQVACFMQGAGRLHNLKKLASFEIGVGPYPYSDALVQEPYNLHVGGSSFWVMRGFSDREYEGVAEFFNFVMRPDIQARWHVATGYLPITKEASFVAESNDFYEENSAARVALDEVLFRPQGDFTKGIRLGRYIEIRNIIIDALEQAFRGRLSAEEALNEAVQKGNILLEEYEQRHKK